jgi:succinyl-diaminopimelate desuccinylase
VGRDGASDAIAFLQAGIPAVEFGPAGGGHHGPDEWVSISSLARYRQALTDFVRALPDWLERERGGSGLQAIEGGLA